LHLVGHHLQLFSANIMPLNFILKYVFEKASLHKPRDVNTSLHFTSLHFTQSNLLYRPIVLVLRLCIQFLFLSTFRISVFPKSVGSYFGSLPLCSTCQAILEYFIPHY